MPTPQTLHVLPTAELAPRALLPGDPGRALAMATELLDAPVMFNHNRGLWGYSGVALDGAPLTIQSTGMGGPSAAIVLHELAQLGLRRAIRTGTCGALTDTHRLGDLLVARDALAADGASRGLGGGERPAAAAALTAALERATATTATTIVSTDLFYEPRAGREQRWRADGALAVEMEAATIFAAGAQLGLATGAVFVVSDTLLEKRRRIEPQALETAALRMARAALAALAAD